MKLFTGTIISVGLIFLTAFKVSTYELKRSTAEVDQIQGLYIFTDSKPVMEDTYLGTSKGAGGGGAGLNPQYEIIRNRMITKVRKEYPNANGVILHLNPDGKDLADALLIK